jgi:soluble calcium-activated nucleotidase 1
MLGVLVVVIITIASVSSMRGFDAQPTSSQLNSRVAECPACPDCFPGAKILASNGGEEVINIKIVSDMDRSSKSVSEGGDTVWHAVLKSGSLTRHSNGNYSIHWGTTTTLESMFSCKGRGMELSELVRFDGRLLSVDDTTGIVYEIIDAEHAVPWTILVDGDRRHGNKGFKSEWATVKNNILYVGSIGKEWTHPVTAEVINSNPQWIKAVSANGHVTSIDWSQYYNKMRVATGTSSPGYMVHESANWHPRLQRWVFLPRRMSREAYDEVKDERRAANTMILATENFSTIEVINNIGPKSDVRGFSAFRFIPSHDTEFVALKSVEDGSDIFTYITVLNMEGQVLMEETLIDNVKFEGLEIVP